MDTKVYEDVKLFKNLTDGFFASHFPFFVVKSYKPGDSEIEVSVWSRGGKIKLSLGPDNGTTLHYAERLVELLNTVLSVRSAMKELERDSQAYAHSLHDRRPC